ncbi:Hap43p-repressed protein [Candida albicans P75063]|nr:Hap43p-repressed protein [Candida albicans P75063]
MTINNYFQLTFYLVSQYINEIYPTSEGFKQVQFTDDTKLKQVKLFKGEEQLLILSFTEISETQSLVNLLNIVGRLDNALINWEWFITDSDYTVKFPIDASKIPQDLIDKFKTKFRLIVDDEKVSSIFSNTPKGPIIEEHTDSESIRSPTPELPYNPVATTATATATQPQQQPPAAAHPDNSIFTGSSVSTTKRPSDMPDFDDEYEIKNPPPPQPLTNQLGRNNNNNNVIPSIGSDDLNPPGIPQHPTLTPFIDPLQNSQGQHQGMYPTSDHPIFGQHQQGQGPNSRAPPGARFDDPFGGSSSEGPFGGPSGNPFGGSSGGHFGGI